MEQINFKKEITSSMEAAVIAVTEKLKDQGFGVLTRIDLHIKIKEKLNKDIKPAIILGACNPQLAYDMYNENSDVASLLPCNAVLRDIGNGKVSVELAKPSTLIKILGESRLAQQALEADKKLILALEELH